MRNNIARGNEKVLMLRADWFEGFFLSRTTSGHCCRQRLIKLVIECLISWKTLPIISELMIISCDSSDLVP